MKKYYLFVSLLSMFVNATYAEDALKDCAGTNNTVYTFSCSKDAIPKALQVIQTDSSVTSLKLWTIDGGDINTIAFSRNLPQRVNTFELRDTATTDIGLKVLLQNSNFMFIRIANENNIHMNSEAMAMLAKNTTLIHFDIIGSDLSHTDFSVLANNKTLRNLHMGYDNISADGALQLAKTVQVDELLLNQNNVGDEGAIALANNPSIRRLSLANNNITDAGALAFANNTTLQCLNLAGNAISEATLEKLKQTTKIDIYTQDDGGWTCNTWPMDLHTEGH